jgi:hypothetical protein
MGWIAFIIFVLLLGAMFIPVKREEFDYTKKDDNGGV